MALRIALDTNRYSEFILGDAPTVNAMRDAHEVHIPFIVLAELRAGFQLGRQRDHNEKSLGEFMRSPRVSVLFPDEATCQIWAELFTDLRQRGRPIPTQDLWIAALAIQHDLVLLTRDRHFEAVPRLMRM